MTTLHRQSAVIFTEGDTEVEVSSYGLNAITIQLRNGDSQCHVTINNEEATLLINALRALSEPSNS